MTNKIYFKTCDKNTPTLVYDMAFPSSHHSYFMKSDTLDVYREKEYKGDGIFGGKDFFILIAEMNFKKHKTRTKSELRELGTNLYNGTQKIFIGGKEKTLKWPEIVADDERPWLNRKSEKYATPPVYPETQGKNVECDCDVCCAICNL